MKRHGEDIRTYPLRRPISTGVGYNSILEACVSPFEEREAAVYCNYSPAEFYGLPLEERAACVAQYRLHWLVENHIQDAVAAAAEAAQRRKGG